MASSRLPEDWPGRIARRTGLRLGPEEISKAEGLLAARPGLAARDLEGEADWLAGQLTPGETFFFRDHGQFELLRFHLLPEILARRRRQRTLRLWSAGCASGEEAYSLAMLADLALPQRQGWQVSIVATDINREALARARRGRYGRWSFRLAPPALQARYFRAEGDEWVLREDIRAMVDFRPGNLVADVLPDAFCRDMDIILCRNVLIYFDSQAVCAVAAKLAACLAEGGYLVVGHTELMGCPQPELASRLFPEGVVYQRRAVAPAPLQPRSAAEPAALPPAPPARRPPRRHAPATAVPGPSSPFDEARARADRGDYTGAESLCRQALAADPLGADAHFLLAQLAQLRGDYGEAETQLNRTLYLAPGKVAAYLELAALHEQAGNPDKAQRRRRAALDLLRRLPPEARVEPFEASAGQLARWLEETECL